ncbi:MAG: VCBS repeat-containing protein, partial [Planctomycetota bacterium]
GPDIPVDVVEKDTCVYYGDGTGPQTPCVLLVPDFGGIPADLDGDGDLDFVDAVKIDPLAPFTAEVRIDVVENLGAGAYSAPLTQAIDPFSFVFGFPFAGDLDGDGVAEVVLGRPAGAIEILGGGAGPIALQPEGYVTASADGLAPPRVVDIDGDGRLDIVTSGSLYELTVGYFQTPAGDFTQGRALVGPRPGTRPDRSAWLDLDLDGDQDLASVKATLDGIDLIENPGSAPFVDLGTVSIAPFRGDVLRTADFEGDGDTDLVFLDVVQDRLGWVENGPGGVFALAATVPTGFDPSAIETGDFNGDGLLDVVVEERGLLGAFVVERPSVYLGAAGGTFAPPVPLVDLPFVDPARFLEALFAVDVDGDGNLDVVRAGNSTGSTFFGEARVDWFKGFGDGTFAPRQLLLTTDTLPLAFEDHDGDGITDLLTRSRGNTQGGTSAFWFRGLGAQSYAPPARLASDADERIQVTTSDLDADGDRDLVVMGFKESYVDVYPFTSRGELGLPYCEQPVANTTGETGRLRASGSAQVSDGSLVLTADRLPPSTFGLFVTGTVPTSNPIANSVGLLCVGGQIGRFVQPGQIQATNAAGEVSLDVDPGALPAGGTVISAAPGATHYFQLWHRDFDAGGAPTSNLTSAVAVLMF